MPLVKNRLLFCVLSLSECDFHRFSLVFFRSRQRKIAPYAFHRRKTSDIFVCYRRGTMPLIAIAVG